MLKLKLGEYLKEHKISMYWLADKAGMRYNTVWDYCKGEVKSPKLDNLYRIMKALNIKDPSLIFEFVEEAA